jgi:hypothetical protein
MLVASLALAFDAAAAPSSAVPWSQRGLPDWMAGPFAGVGSPLTPARVGALTITLLGLYLLVVLCGSAVRYRWAIAAIVALHVVYLLAPPLLLSDVFNYIAYGQMGLHGINPYAHGPGTLIGQPVYGYTGHLWKRVPSAYGPLFTLASYPLASLGIAGAFWALKVMTALACVATAALACVAAKRLGRSPRAALVLVALNPLVLVYAVGGAHNDLIAAAFLAAAVYLAVSGRAASAGAVAVAAVAIKLSAGLALPFVILGARPRLRAFAGAVAAAVVTVVASLMIFGPAIAKMLDALAVQQRFKWIVVSPTSFVAHYLHLGRPDHLTRQLITAATAAGIVALIARARGGRGWIEGAAAATLVLLATSAWVLPWYIVWALPFVALVRQRALLIGAVGLTGLLLAMQLDHFVLTHASHAHGRELQHRAARADHGGDATRASRTRLRA